MKQNIKKSVIFLILALIFFIFTSMSYSRIIDIDIQRQAEIKQAFDREVARIQKQTRRPLTPEETAEFAAAKNPPKEYVNLDERLGLPQGTISILDNQRENNGQNRSLTPAEANFAAMSAIWEHNYQKQKREQEKSLPGQLINKIKEVGPFKLFFPKEEELKLTGESIEAFNAYKNAKIILVFMVVISGIISGFCFIKFVININWQKLKKSPRKITENSLNTNTPDKYIETLKKLNEFRASGIISEEEFTKKKIDILNKL